MLLRNVQKDRVMTVIPGMLHGHQITSSFGCSGCNKVVINWMNGAWEVKGDEHAVPVRGVVDQFVRWFLEGTFRPRADENNWCRHIFRESNKAADTHANWLMDNGNSGPGAQWVAPDVQKKMHKTRHIILSFDGAKEGERIGCGCLETVVTG